ncbi:MAG: isopeptide-forming domain-containing fimbrial protein, partial [Gammaproteobacteria bacterium]|nr:isopeptide-forming domain-containing fimbrial protein [Gammaproteobacteria bacterium]
MQDSSVKNKNYSFGMVGSILAKIAFLLVLFLSTSVKAGEFCSASPFFGVVDGAAGYPIPTQISIDTDCTFQNFTADNPLTATISFQTNDPSIYLIVFNNVVFTGNMACANIEHKIWFVNGSDYGSSNNCQDLFIPAETIDKQNPVGKTSVSIGEPFIYTLTLPYMNDGLGSPSPNELRNVVLFDDIAAMGVDLSFVGITAYYKGSGIPVVMVPEDQPTPTSICGAWTGTSLCYKPLSIINPGEQIIVELTLVLNDVVTNVAGLSFFNTAQWWFDRDIDIDEDGIIQPDEQFTELPGEWGISAPLLIAEPDLIVTKTSPATTLNLGISADFTIDVQNVGGSDAWDVTILDLLPDTPTAGMCDFDPTASVTAQMFAADGVTPLAGSLLPGIDYTITYSGSPTCELQFTMLSSAAVIGPSEHLIITYTSELDALPTDTGDGVDLINVAGATQWFSADEPPVGATYSRRTYARTLTDGTTTISDHEDSHLLTTGLTGYFFQKTANNLTTTQYPATFGAPGDTIQYRLRLYNIDTLFTNINITDTLNPAFFDTNTFAMVSLPPGTTYTFNNITGEFHLYGNGSPLNLTSYGEIIVEFKINLASSLVNGDTVSNQADLTSDTVSTISDDPFVNGTSAPGEASDPTVINIQTPSPALKTATQTTATIGEQVVYQITIPETPINFPLYDVKIRDNLAASATDINFVSASVVSGGSWSLTNTGTSTNVILEDIATGIDIVAGGQIVIDMTVEVQNTSNNNRGDVFDNLVSYTFNRTNGLASSQVNVVDSLPASMTLVEAELVASKTATVITPAPISGGSIIEYQISLTNNGDSTAFNINVFDTFSPYLDLNSAFTPTAQIDGAPVAGFIDIPLIEPTGEIIWGQGNGDLSLDLPAGSTLVLTYQAVVNTSTAVSFNNTAHVDWRSLDFATASERDGTGCPTITAPDDYCVTAISVTLTSVDNNSLVKSVVSDSWITDGSTANDSTVRIGDTVTYRLALSLGEGVTESVAVTDVLPAGMAFDSLVAITPASGASVFNYTLASQPANGDTGNLAWNFSTVTNNPSNDGTPNDSIVIEYVARVLPDAGITQQPSTSLTNTATLAYLDVNGVTVVDPARLQSTATITLLQPVMTNLSKVGNGVSNTMATPLNVDVANDTVAFQLQSCNVASPAAPAYDVLISDVLATQFDEVSISGLTVSIGGINATQGADYLLTLPATRGGTLQIQIIKPVLAGQCVVVDYQIGFYTDFGANQTWNNAASLGEYWSLPSSSGQQFVDGIISSFYLSNVVGATPLSKVISVPATNEVTIGDTVTYTITIPSTPVSAALSNVVLTDQLHDALTYLSASAVDLAGNPIALTDTTSGQSVNLAIAQIPAGEQAIVILQTRVANNSFANAGISFDNTASYTHADLPVPVTATSAQLNIVEPSINVNKTVSPTIAPNPGDVLTYTVTLVSDSGANFSSAFDLVIEDSLTLGMAYQAGSASITGTGNTIGEPIIAGDGVATAQTLRWDLASGTADIDVPEGATVTLTYAVDVLPSAQPGQQLTNSVVAKWTGLDGINVNERDGSGAPVENDYFSAPVTASLITQPSALSKVTSQTQVTIGETITYQITVPSIPSPTPLDNVRILDDLNGLSADLGFVSVSKISGSQPWTPVNTGDSKNLIIEDPNIGIDIPANEQVVIEIQLLVNDSAVNVNGLTFANTADYTYGATQDPGQSGTSNTTTIIEPDVLILEKTGPDTLRLGQPGTFIINVHNTGTSPAWDVTVKDQLPNPTPGGMCANAPTGITAQIFAADGITPVSAVLVQDTDYQISFLGEPDCSITFTMMSAAAAIGADQRLIISYVAEIDPDTPSNIQLTNIASAIQWYSQ